MSTVYVQGIQGERGSSIAVRGLMYQASYREVDMLYLSRPTLLVVLGIFAPSHGQHTALSHNRLGRNIGINNR